MSVLRGQRVAAYVVCVDADDQLLLCRLSDVTGRPGWWTLPGGGVEFGEHPADAAVRELREETGLVGRVTGLAAVDSVAGLVHVNAAGDEVDLHRIRIIYRCEITGGELRFETDGSTDAARWFSKRDVDNFDLVEVGVLGTRLAWDAPQEPVGGAR